IAFANHGCQQGVVPQVIMVVEVLIAQSQSVDSLGDEMLKRVLDELRVTMIREARGELLDDPGERLGLAEQQAATVGGNVTAIESGDDLARAKSREIQVGRVGRVERDFRGAGPAIDASATPGAPITVGLGFTVCHCRVSFPRGVYCFAKYIYVLKGTRRQI